MLCPNKPAALYRQLYYRLRQEIESGELLPGNQLPSERNLATYYGISRITARKALGLLVQDGYVEAHQGKGSFVRCALPASKSGFSGSFGVSMMQSSPQHSSRLLGLEVESPTAELVESLRISRAEKVICVRRLHFIDQAPVALETSFLPYLVCKKLLVLDLTKRTIPVVLEQELGLRLRRAQQTVKAIMATEQELALLELPAPSALLLLQRVTKDNLSRVIEFSHIVYHGDCYQVDICPQQLLQTL